MILWGMEILPSDIPNANEEHDCFHRFNDMVLKLSAEELDKLIQFLEESRSFYEGVECYGHDRLQDWDKDWSEKEVDIVINYNVLVLNDSETNS